MPYCYQCWAAFLDTSDQKFRNLWHNGKHPDFARISFRCFDWFTFTIFVFNLASIRLFHTTNLEKILLAPENLKRSAYYKQTLSASSHGPGNRAGTVTGTIFVFCPYGKFQPGRPWWNSRNTTKMVGYKLVSFAAVVALWTLVTLLTKLIRILLK